MKFRGKEDSTPNTTTIYLLIYSNINLYFMFWVIMQYYIILLLKLFELWELLQVGSCFLPIGLNPVISLSISSLLIVAWRPAVTPLSQHMLLPLWLLVFPPPRPGAPLRFLLAWATLALCGGLKSETPHLSCVCPQDN